MKKYTYGFPILFCLILGTQPLDAQHRDISIYQNSDGEVTIHDTGVDTQPEMPSYRRDFDFWGVPQGLYAGNDPGLRQSGLNPPSGYAALPGEMIIDISFVPIHVPGVAAGNLLFWDGNGSEVEFAPLPAGHVLFVEDAANVDFSMHGDHERVEGPKGGITDTSGGVHEHLEFLLENNGSAPADGYYATGWIFDGDGVEPSRLTAIVFSTPGLPATMDTLIDDWLTSHIDQITMAGDFNADGEYSTEDIDSLVAAIASGGDDPVFDLDGDGATSISDLTLWREIAGRVNNTSGAPLPRWRRQSGWVG